MTSDELTAVCPVTGQSDLYVATIEYWPLDLFIESKSLKLYRSGFRNEAHPDKVRVTLKQKARGGITITATS